MPQYRVNEAGVAKARELIGAGRVDRDAEWSHVAPTTEEQDEHIERHGYDGFGEWHLALDPDASEGTKGRYRFPFGDYSRVSRAALVHAKQRATQYDHDAVAAAADELLGLLDQQ